MVLLDFPFFSSQWGIELMHCYFSLCKDFTQILLIWLASFSNVFKFPQLSSSFSRVLGFFFEERFPASSSCKCSSSWGITADSYLAADLFRIVEDVTAPSCVALLLNDYVGIYLPMSVYISIPVEMVVFGRGVGSKCKLLRSTILNLPEKSATPGLALGTY